MKLLTVIKCSLLCLFSLVSGGVLFAQNRSRVSVSGVVTDASSAAGDGIPYAVVTIKSIGVSTITDIDGNYVLENLPPAEYEISASSLGYETATLKANVSKTTKLDFALKIADFTLDEVVVSATASKTGAATASNISKTAMEHVQANSLADVMQLLPGADISSSKFRPDLQGVRQQTIRGGAAMGTSVIVDGAPLSNTANLQTMSGAMGGGAAGENGVGPSSGIDFRSITTDNVESIEVIRGVASVQYGDATAGTVIVNAKSGREPMTLRFSTNPNIYSVGITQGVALGSNKGFVNYGADYAISVKDPREGYDSYQRVTSRVGYSNTWGKFSSNSALSFTWTKDKADPNPDDEVDYNAFNSRDYGFRLTNGGTYNVSKGWFQNFKYNLAFNFTDRLSYYADKTSGGDVAYSFSKVDGSVLSSIAGQRIYDADGNELTNFGSDLAGERSWITPTNYDYWYNVYGKELNGYAKIMANFLGNTGALNHHIIVGADYNTDGNVGRGKVFDRDAPPFRSVSYKFATQRERAYKDIPFLNRVGAYAEETMKVEILRRQLEVVAGVRYDYVSGISKGALTPRINASYEIIPDVLSIRGAYGVNVKTPSIAYIYPDNAYFDMVNFDNSLASNVPDAQKFQLITTHVYDASNPNLELAKQTKYEVGLDLHLGRMNFEVTAYKDFCGNGYSFSRTLDSYRFIPFNRYVVDGGYNPDGTTLPALRLNQETSDNYLLQYTVPSNNNTIDRRGVEFVMDFGRIDAIRTSFILNGQWYDYSSWNNGWVFYNKSGVMDSNVGLYSSKTSEGISRSSNFITNLIVTHNIPELGFVVSLTSSVSWCEKGYSWTIYGDDDDIPVKYIDIADGKIYDFDRSLIADPESESYKTWLPILRNEVNGAIASDRRFIEPAFKPALCVNLNVTKQYDRFSVSFYANNVFRTMPIQYIQKYPGSYVHRNTNSFFFGLQMTAKIF